MIYKTIEVTIGLRMLGTAKDKGVVTIWSNPLEKEEGDWKREQTITVAIQDTNGVPVIPVILDYEKVVKDAIGLVYRDLDFRKLAVCPIRVTPARPMDLQLAVDFAKQYSEGLGIDTTVGANAEKPEAVAAVLDRAAGKGKIVIGTDVIKFK